MTGSGRRDPPDAVGGRLELPSTAEAAARARRHVAEVATGWDPDELDDALLMTSELVTNAVHHGHGVVQLVVVADDDRVRVEVADANPAPVRAPTAAPSSTTEGGRGLFLVDSLASRWGWEPRSAPVAKAVWFELWRPGGRSPGSTP